GWPQSSDRHDHKRALVQMQSVGWLNEVKPIALIKASDRFRCAQPILLILRRRQVAGSIHPASPATAALNRRLPVTVSPLSRRSSKSPEARHSSATTRLRLTR